MAQLLVSFENIRSIPFESLLIRYKTPTDVYKRLLKCYTILKEIAKFSEHEFLEFKYIKGSFRQKEPSDVYDLSTLLIADISYLHTFRKGAHKSQKAYYSGFKIPSQVYQRVGILQTQLETLLKLVKKIQSG
ncbi:MAG: hypothetical protein COA33_007485 [Fluviicola sp.]|nr:hypothetical protein [Fluviicola sp.]